MDPARWKNVNFVDFVPENNYLRINRVSSAFSPLLLKMLEEGIHADVTLKAIGGSMKAHKSVLSCVSPVFCAMFEHNMREKATSCVEIPDMTIKALQLFLLLVYIVNEGEDCTKSDGLHHYLKDAIDKHFVEFHDAVRKYQVETLKMYLRCALVRNLTPENCWYYYECERAGDTSLSQFSYFRDSKYVSYGYILNNYTDVFRCKEILEVMARDPALVRGIVIAAENLHEPNLE